MADRVRINILKNHPELRFVNGWRVRVAENLKKLVEEEATSEAEAIELIEKAYIENYGTSGSR